MSELKIEAIRIRKTKWGIPNLGQNPRAAGIEYRPGNVMQTSIHVFEVICNTGLVGSFVGGNSVAATQARSFADYLIGKDPLAREGIARDLKRLLRKFDGLGAGPVDIALWDLAGKHYGAPIAELLGGYRVKLPAYASTTSGDRCGGLDSPDAYADFASQCKSLGYRGFKLHIWVDSEVNEVIETMRAVRTKVGDGFDLMIDPGCLFDTFADAWRVGQACDDNNFLWYEDPYKDGGVSIHGHGQLRSLIRTPILATEMVRGLEQHTDFMKAGATDFCRADAEYDGGITGAMKIAHAAEGFGLDVELHAPGPHHRHMMSAIRNSNFYEMSLVHPNTDEIGRPHGIYACDYRDTLTSVDADGCVSVPTGPGLGVEYDWKALAERTEETWEFS